MNSNPGRRRFSRWFSVEPFSISCGIFRNPIRAKTWPNRMRNVPMMMKINTAPHLKMRARSRS